MNKVYAVPMIAFISVGPGENTDEHIEKLQALASMHGLGQLLQDELIDPEEVGDLNEVHSVADLTDNPLVKAIADLITASAAPWRTLSNEPDAVKFILRLEEAAKAAKALVG
jgi:hypothetical protein